MRFTELPECLQAAYARQPRRSFASAGEKQKSPNNFVAEAKPRDLQKTHSVSEVTDRASPLGGRNAKGAGARRGNRNAAGGGLYRLCLRRIRLKQQLDRQHYQLLVLTAAVEHLQARAASTAKTNISQNNYLAEGRALGPENRAAVAPLPPTPDRYNNYLARSLALPLSPSRALPLGSGPRSPPKAAQILVESAGYRPLSGWTSW